MQVSTLTFSGGLNGATLLVTDSVSNSTLLFDHVTFLNGSRLILHSVHVADLVFEEVVATGAAIEGFNVSCSQVTNKVQRRVEQGLGCGSYIADDGLIESIGSVWPDELQFLKIGR